MLDALLAVSLALVAGGPNLTVRDVSVVRSGEHLRVTHTLANAGTRRAAASRVEYRAGGRVAAVRRFRALAPGATARRTVRLSGVSSVAVCVDGDCTRSLAAPVIAARPADPTAMTTARFV